MNERVSTSRSGKASRSDRYVAVSCEGVVGIHLPDATGNYATLCGVDGDDPALQMHMAEVPQNAKVDCRECKQIWDVARQFREADFAPRLKGE